jgi:hypothetical protein
MLGLLIMMQLYFGFVKEMESIYTNYKIVIVHLYLNIRIRNLVIIRLKPLHLTHFLIYSLSLQPKISIFSTHLNNLLFLNLFK